MSIYNKFVITPRMDVEYNGFRGCTDFTKIGLFNQYETGYPWLAVISMPKFMEVATHSDAASVFGDNHAYIKQAIKQFRQGLEYEFRGLSGLPDTTADTTEITDGINSQKMISKVTRESSVTISMPYFEKTGGLYTKNAEWYLTGLKDPVSQAKTYHGLIQAGKCAPGLEKEVFTFMYWTTDATMVRIEKAWLLANAQLTKAETSMYDSTRGDISNKEITLEFNAYAIPGYEVDQAAYTLLQDITGVHHNPYAKLDKDMFGPANKVDKNHVAILDSTSDTSHFGIFGNAGYKKDEVTKTLRSLVDRAGTKKWKDPTKDDYYSSTT